MLDFPVPPLYTFGCFLIIAVGALLPVRLERRQDHVVPTISAAVTIALLGPRSILLVIAGFAVAAVVRLGWRAAVLRRDPSRPDDTFASIAWLGVTLLSMGVAFVIFNFLYSTVFDRSYPMTLTTTEEIYTDALMGLAAWIGAMSVRVLSQRWVSGPVMQGGLDPFDSVLIPYLVPTICGFPIITASIALYRPEAPWPSLTMLLWCFPLYGVTRLELHRRHLAQELRRETAATQRLAAIGEVSARVVHQSRHQVGLMGWSIYRLRARLDQLDEGGPISEADRRAVRDELDALADAKDRLGEMLASELLHERRVEDGSAPGLAELVDDVVAQLRAEADHEGVVLHVVTGPSVADEPAPAPLRDVVFNLVDNAIDAASTNVTIEVDGGPTGATVAVSDDGPGLPERDAHRVFEPFFTTKGDGTGMGLAIADALVGDLGGDLRHERVGDRTVFRVTLPPTDPRDAREPRLAAATVTKVMGDS